MSFCNAQGHVYFYAGDLTEEQKQGLPCSCGQTFYHTKNEYAVEICPHCGQKIFKSAPSKVADQEAPRNLVGT